MAGELENALDEAVAAQFEQRITNVVNDGLLAVMVFGGPLAHDYYICRH